MKFVVPFFLHGVILISLSSCLEETNSTTLPNAENNSLEAEISNVLNLVYDSTLDIPNLFFDKGSWHGYGLNNGLSIGFYGPYSLTDNNGFEISNNLSEFGIKEFTNAPNITEQHYYLDRLTTHYQLGQLEIDMTLAFASSKTTVIEAKVSNPTSNDITITPYWKGNIPKVTTLKDGIIQINNTFISIANSSTPISFINSGYFQEMAKVTLSPGESNTYRICQSIGFSQDELKNEQTIIASVFANHDFISSNTENWRTKTKHLIDPLSDSNQRLMTKCIATLNNNWKSAAGELKHEGLFPAYSNRWFQGFWSWDSWKHAVAVAQFNLELAKNQIRTMYDYQNDQGMIVDCIFRDTSIEKHNWRDSKPPLSGWAIWELYEQDQDKTFLKEMYPKLVDYHNFWYQYRDANQNGLCEYGSTDGTLIAAKWESGMDNAVRFDSSRLIQNGTNAYSLNQESVDLNAYLYFEKMMLYNIASVLNKEDANEWKKAAEELKNLVSEKMYDPLTGWFYDIEMNSGNFIKVKGPEGWTPLWTGLAQKDQAERIKNNIVLEDNFNTWVPFPTIEANHEFLDPFNGYWRGPVWIDQVYFGLEGLKKYGYHDEALELQNKLLNNCEGLYDQSPIRENYHPLTGEGLNATHFSWSAAHILLLLKQ